MKKEKTGIIIFITIIAILIGLVYFAQNSNNSNKSATTHAVSNLKMKSEKYIAAIYLEGEITEKTKDYDQKWILQTIQDLKNDEKNAAIVLFINSPGGSVYEADEVFLKLLDYKTTEKKLYVYQGALAASGGYYISCAADKIYANRNTLTGSIGVISGQTFDVTEFLNKHGIKSETIHAGKNKNMGNFNEPMTEEQKNILQTIADECYEQFTSIVAENRKIDIEQVLKIADGRIYTAKQALNLKLIDKIDTWDNMITDLKKEINEANCDIIDFTVPKQESSILDLLNLLNQTSTNLNNPQTELPYSVRKQINQDIKYPAYLYNF